MSVTWQSVYDKVTDALMEPNGFVLGIMTVSDFLRIAGQVYGDFIAKTGIYKRMANLQQQTGVSTYSLPDGVGEVIAAASDQESIEEMSGYYLDNGRIGWQGEIGQPEWYRQDEISPESIQLIPAPSYQGNGIPVTGGSGFGTVQSVTAVEFGIDLDPASVGYGTVSIQTDGNPYIEPVNAGYGVVAEIIPSTGNLSVFGPAIPSDLTSLQLTSVIRYIPDSFWPFLAYGILERIFTGDTEEKDMARGAYCHQRYAEGITIAQVILRGDYLEE